MKTILLSLFFLISLNSFGQSRQFFSRTLGVDLLPFVLLSGDGRPAYNETELIFTEQIGEKTMRFKLNLNNRNVYSDDLVRAELIEDNKPNHLIYLINEYQSNTNVKLSFGLAKLFKGNDLNIYYGADLNLGMNRGWVNTFTRKTEVHAIWETNIASKKESILFMGITPVLGVNLPLGKRIVFGLEFGIECNYLFKSLEYRDSNNEYLNANSTRLDFNPLKVLNDFSVRVRF